MMESNIHELHSTLGLQLLPLPQHKHRKRKTFKIPCDVSLPNFVETFCRMKFSEVTLKITINCKACNFSNAGCTKTQPKQFVIEFIHLFESKKNQMYFQSISFFYYSIKTKHKTEKKVYPNCQILTSTLHIL